MLIVVLNLDIRRLNNLSNELRNSESSIIKKIASDALGILRLSLNMYKINSLSFFVNSLYKADVNSFFWTECLFCVLLFLTEIQILNVILEGRFDLLTAVWLNF